MNTCVLKDGQLITHVRNWSIDRDEPSMLWLDIGDGVTITLARSRVAGFVPGNRL